MGVASISNCIYRKRTVRRVKALLTQAVTNDSTKHQYSDIIFSCTVIDELSSSQCCLISVSFSIVITPIHEYHFLAYSHWRAFLKPMLSDISVIFHSHHPIVNDSFGRRAMFHSSSDTILTRRHLNRHYSLFFFSRSTPSVLTLTEKSRARTQGEQRNPSTGGEQPTSTR